MKFVHPEITTVIDTELGKLNTIVIENQPMFSRLIRDLQQQISGDDGDSVISDCGKPLEPSKYAELLDRFIPFEINRKNLITKITAELENKAVSESYFSDTMTLLGKIEHFLDDIAFDFSCDITFPKLTIGALIRAASPMIRDDYDSIPEKVIDYMELVSELERKKLFFTVNMRSYISDHETMLFADTVLSHGFHVIMLENREYPKFSLEQRLIVDRDLCEIT